MKGKTFCEQNKEFVSQLSIYNRIFQHGFIPKEKIVRNEDELQQRLELMKKSCEEKYDYVAEYYNIDVEHRKKHYDVIND
jgi:hypothetical protein